VTELTPATAGEPAAAEPGADRPPEPPEPPEPDGSGPPNAARGSSDERTVTVPLLARVEGEGALHVRVQGDTVTEVELRIFEPPRFFEALLRGRGWTEPPDITARICGICPVAYQMSACLAIEQACGVSVPDELRLLRRLLYCGEWISSHALHIYLLHAPDFLGYQGMMDLAADHPDLVERGLRLKQAGNQLISAIGGRSVHPVNVRVGGFYRLPTPQQLLGLRPALERALQDALATVRLVSGFTFPDLEQPQDYVALRAAEGYPLEGGRVVTTGGPGFEVSEFGVHVLQEQVSHSNALHARLVGGRAFVVGPIARYALNSDRLTPLARRAAQDAGLGPVCRNPFRSIVVRSVELVYAVEEALRIIDAWRGAEAPAIDVPARAGTGHGATEAPRGVLYHRYTLDDDGTILAATIVPPTSQNLASMESDLRQVVQQDLGLPLEDLTLRCEQTVRNYDPCISCATHFLDLRIERDRPAQGMRPPNGPDQGGRLPDLPSQFVT
jgi:sulfhydrogenase subunit alpha